jgi:hypothetical protein
MRIHEEQPFTPDDLPGCAAKVFGWAMANPDLIRLIAWSALENAKGPAERGASPEPDGLGGCRREPGPTSVQRLCRDRKFEREQARP